MREILFRGKTLEREWVQGDLSQHTTGKKFIRCKNKNALCSCEVIPETVGQYTGLTDKNGKKIFEGDIVKCFSSDYIGTPKINLIKVEDMTDYNTMVYLNCSDRLVIIGNIHDNPELLGGEG